MSDDIDHDYLTNRKILAFAFVLSAMMISGMTYHSIKIQDNRTERNPITLNYASGIMAAEDQARAAHFFTEYKAAMSDLEKRGKVNLMLLRSEEFKYQEALCQNLDSRYFAEWSAILKDVHIDNRRQAIITLETPIGPMMGVYNVSPKDPEWNIVANLDIGSQVKISGEMSYDRKGCFKTAELTHMDRNKNMHPPISVKISSMR